MNKELISEKFINAGGFKTRYLEGGSINSDPVILLHDGAFGGAADTSWSRLAPYLVDAGYHVLIPDMLGFGGTDKVHFFDRSPIAFRAKHIADFCQSLNLSGVHFIGTSFGGTLIMRALAMTPLLWPFASACSIAGTGGPWRIADAMATLANFDGSVESTSKISSLLVDPDHKGFDFKNHVTERHALCLVPGHYTALNAARAKAPWEESKQAPDSYPSSLKGCEIPLLLVEPTDDPTCEPDWTVKVKEVISSVEIEKISGRHSPNIDRPDLVADVLLRWLGRCNSAARPISKRA